ncbi:hypothetical protein [Brevibacillus sp. HD1.4A]|uniref:hypothetical protein n=1 Tax=Brevibacillus sp. HD1.4A TaxID=2738978 RepID=UPI00156A9196|nr:hypothetical protein [Brevibacillus sp. HD1.4A]NRQ51992.1 hypothetical protein [Brevibacillus sp. HD1.4A]
MKNKLLSLFFVVALLCFGTGASAADVPTQIPGNIKTIDELTNYLTSQGIVKTFDDLRAFLEKNKATIQRISPGVIDYGFTMSFYTEINKPTVDNGLKLVPANQNQEWIVYVSVMNFGDTPKEISKDSFALVPHLLEPGNEVNVLSLSPEYIVAAETGNAIKSAQITKGEEKYFGIVFRPGVMTSKENVKLRLYDGKDHVDISIVKK